jgi:hypothetical protein
MSVVLKWQATTDEPAKIPWQAGVRVTHVQVRAEDPSIVDIWVHHHDYVPAHPTAWREFFITGTGHQIDPGWEVVGTTVHPRSPLVWHIVTETQSDDSWPT